MNEPDAARTTIFAALGALADGLAVASTPAEVLATLADGARSLLPFTACALALRASDGWQVWRTTAARPQGVSFNDQVPTPAADTLSRFLSHGQGLAIDDLLAPPWGESSHRNVLWKDGTRSALLITLRAAGKEWGALSFTATQPDCFSPTDRDAATFLGWMVAATLHTLPKPPVPEAT